MGNIISFPLMRRRPHAALVWDNAWDQYRIQVVGCLAPAAAAEWCDDYGEAIDRLISMGERLGLPIIDMTPERESA